MTGNDPAMTRRRLTGADRRAQLLDVARDIVAADGYSALTIEAVATRSGLSRTVVFQHFTDRSGLTEALLDWESAVAFAGIGSVDGAQGIDQLGRGILAYLHAAPTSWRIILRPPDGAPPEARARIELGRGYARSVAARQLRIDPNGLTTRVLLAAIEELARLHLDDPSAHPDEEILAHLRSLVGWAAGATTG
jgi:AcrR family transcriptional regulator